MRDACRKFDDFEAALNVALRIGDRLAMLFGEQLGQSLHLSCNEIEKFHQHTRTPLRIDCSPVGLGGEGAFHRCARFCFRRERSL